jgi:hypothetical protein
MSKVRDLTDNISALSIFVAVGESVSLTSAARKLQMPVSGGIDRATGASRRSTAAAAYAPTGTLCA